MFDRISIRPIKRRKDGVLMGVRIRVDGQVAGAVKIDKTNHSFNVNEVCNYIADLMIEAQRELPYIILTSQVKDAPPVSEEEAAAPPTDTGDATIKLAPEDAVTMGFVAPRTY